MSKIDRRTFAALLAGTVAAPKSAWSQSVTAKTVYYAGVGPELNLYDHRWPIRTRVVQQPPAKFVFAQEGQRMGIAMDSIVSSGCIISGSRVMRSVLSPAVRVNSFSEVDRSILMPGVTIGRNCRISRAIIDAGVHLPEGTNIGSDASEDADRGYLVTESGITVVPGPSQEMVRTAR